MSYGLDFTWNVTEYYFFSVGTRSQSLRYSPRTPSPSLRPSASSGNSFMPPWDHSRGSELLVSMFVSGTKGQPLPFRDGPSRLRVRLYLSS